MKVRLTLDVSVDGTVPAADELLSAALGLVESSVVDRGEWALLIGSVEAEVLTDTHRHIERGAAYREIGRGHLQAAEAPQDMEELVVYEGEGGALWFRPPREFDDPARFERLQVE